VHAGLVHQHPGQGGQRQQQPPGADALLHQHAEQRDRHQRQQQRHDLQRRGVEDGDDRDGQQVVDDRQGEQEGAQPGGQVGADHREDGEGEGDVGRGGDRPPGQRATPGAQVHRRVEHGRHHHAAHGGGDRESRLARVAEVAGDELALELQAGDEEEDRQQAVGRPGAQRQVQVQPEEVGRADDGVAERLVGTRPWGVRPDQRDQGADHQEDPADGLLAQDPGETPGLEVRARAEQAGGGGHGAAPGCGVG
jgi:hypothetical protein